LNDFAFIHVSKKLTHRHRGAGDFEEFPCNVCLA
jgi:hypothetical protein